MIDRPPLKLVVTRPIHRPSPRKRTCDELRDKIG